MISIKLQKNELDNQFIPGLRHNYWDNIHYCWIIPNYSGYLELIKDYFKERITKLVVYKEIKTNYCQIK